MTHPDVTVVVPTYRRPDRLARTLAGLTAQQPGFPWEIVVVDNDPAGSAEATVTGTRIEGVPVRYTTERTPGATSARNHGIDVAAGRVVAMLDDDVVPATDWLALIAGPVLAGEVAGTGGRVLLDPAVPRPRWFDEAGIGGYLTAYAPDTVARPLTEEEFLVTANAAFDRATLQAVGGFDPTLGPRGRVQLVCDDTALLRAVQRSGGTVRYLPDAVVTHDLPAVRLRKGWLLRRAYWQGRSDWLLDARDHRDRRFGGARVAAEHTAGWLRHELAARRAEGLADPAVAFHVACDLARAAGTLGQATRTAVTFRRLSR